MEIKIQPQVFFKHLERLHQIWSKEDSHAMDSIILVNGKGTGGNQKTVAIMSWFFAGYNLAQTIIAITPKSIIIYASDRKITFLKSLHEANEAKKFNLAFIVKSEDFKESYQHLWSQLHGSNSSPKIGMFIGDSKVGQIAEEFVKFLESQSHSKVEITNFFSQCFILKDAEEIQNLKKSAKVTGYFFSRLIKDVELVIDSGKPLKHSDLSKKTVELISNEAQLKKCSIKLSNQKIVKDFIDLGGPVSVQSGGGYSSKIFIQSNQNQLKYDCILLGLGTMYRSYNTFVSRTLLIDPTEQQKSIYKKIQILFKVISLNLRKELKICDIYKKAKLYMQNSLPEIEVPKNFGFGMGIFLTENNLIINESNQRAIQPGFSFLVVINFPDIKISTNKGPKIFAIQISDIVIVGEKGQQVITNEVSKTLTDIFYQLEDQGQGKKDSRPKANTNIIEGKRRKVQEQTNQKLKNQKERYQHQGVLKKKKLEELQQRSNQNFGGEFKQQKTIDCARIQCYKHKQDLPKDLKPKLIYIDHKNNSILLPINGQHVPFHICILKSVVKNDEGKNASLRFNFHIPNSIPTLNFPKYSQPTIFVKEIVFRSQQIGRVAQLQKQVKALQKKVRLQLSQKHAKEDIIQQQRINLNKGKRPILRDLFARPSIGQKKTKGNLECHLNGFRYSNIKNQIIDVAFSNIKYAFFQPCQKQIIAAIHFKLHEPVMVGKKKTEDIQFYSEGGVIAEDVVGRGRDDSDDQEQQRQTKRRIDRDFLAWTRSCEEFTNKAFEFEVPQRNLGFYGTTFRSNVLLQPTKTCIINITEPHFFVFAVENIQVVWFERMTGNVRYFDLTLVHKDYQHYVRINSISIKDVQKVKDWLDSNNIIFYDNKISLNWTKFLQGVRSDFKKFVEDGAWIAWDEAQQAADSGVDSDDSEFSASQSDFGEDSENSDQSSSGFAEQDSDDSDDGDQDLSEQGLSWQQMQQKAEREDREKLKREIEKQKERQKTKKRK